MAPGPLSARVADLCQEVGHRLGGPTQGQVFDVRRRLSEPLRVAIAGRLKSGKSTLVNALIGRRVAPTEVGECTRIVTQFRYGTADRVDVVRRDGSRVSLPLDESGMIPQRLGVPRSEISYVDVALTSDHLRDLMVVDTPGLSSANSVVSAGARRFLFNEAPIDEDIDDDSVGALSGAEAIVYVFTQSVRADDVAALEAFRSISARLSSNPINSLGLFNKVDKLAGGTADPWPVAGPLAADQAAVLGRLGAVQPGEDRQPRAAAAGPGTAARRDRAGPAAARLPPAAAAGGGAAGHHRRRGPARPDGGRADPARAVQRPPVHPQPAGGAGRPAQPGGAGGRHPLAGLRGGRCQSRPVPGGPRGPPGVLPALPARPWPGHLPVGEGVSMSSRPSLVPVAGVAALLALLTG